MNLYKIYTIFKTNKTNTLNTTPTPRKTFRNHLTTITYITSLILLVGIYTFYGAKAYAKSVSEDLSSKVIRFHVLANSDTTEDQLLKTNVRDAVLSYMEPKLKYAKDQDESREIIASHLDQITQVAEQVVANWGKDYSVSVELTHEDFPTKSYGDITFPAGNYEACRILIGEAEGQNWWCVLFPPLCYVDASTGVVPREGKEELQRELTPEQYEIVAYQSEKPYQIKFKLLEWLH